jgi:hypothetical protein
MISAGETRPTDQTTAQSSHNGAAQLRDDKNADGLGA